MSSEVLANRKTKDSVFVSLFRDKQNILQLYRELYPEEIQM